MYMKWVPFFMKLIIYICVCMVGLKDTDSMIRLLKTRRSDPETKPRREPEPEPDPEQVKLCEGLIRCILLKNLYSMLSFS